MHLNLPELEKRKNFLTNIFKHLSQLKPADIAEAVLLISCNDDQASLFDQLASIKRTNSEKFLPRLFTLNNTLKVIDTSESFLHPEVSSRFITMHYLMSTVQRLKLVFVFTDSQTHNRPMRQIRDTLQTVLRMLDQNLDIAKLSKSCAIVISDDDLQLDTEMYKERIIDLGLDEQNFVKDSRVRDLGKAMFRYQHILLCNQAKRSYSLKGIDGNSKKQQNRGLVESFLCLAEKLQYFQTAQSFRPSAELPSNYADFLQPQTAKIDLVWKQIFELFYNNMDVFVIGKGLSMNRVGPQTSKQEHLRQAGQDYLLSQLKQIGFCDSSVSKGTPQYFNKQQHPTVRLVSFINSYFQILEEILSKNQETVELKMQDNQEIMQKLMRALQRGQYLRSPSISNFFMSYFLVRKFLAKEQDDYSVIQKQRFADVIQCTETFNQLMGTFIQKFIKLLQEDLSQDQNYRYQYENIQQQIVQVLGHLKKNSFAFATERILQKLNKLKSTIVYKQAKRSIRTSNTQKTAGLFCKFVQQASQCPLIKQQWIDQAYIYLGDQLTRKSQWILALKMYNMAPQYKIYQKIIKVFEYHLKIAPQLIRYMTEADWKENIHNFREYCKFLTKIGFNQKTRQICLEGLRVAQDQDIVHAIKTELINARGDTSRDLHLQFLEASILEERRLAQDNSVAKQVKQKLCNPISKSIDK